MGCLSCASRPSEVKTKISRHSSDNDTSTRTMRASKARAAVSARRRQRHLVPGRAGPAMTPAQDRCRCPESGSAPSASLGRQPPRSDRPCAQPRSCEPQKAPRCRHSRWHPRATLARPDRRRGRGRHWRTWVSSERSRLRNGTRSTGRRNRRPRANASPRSCSATAASIPASGLESTRSPEGNTRLTQGLLSPSASLFLVRILTRPPHLNLTNPLAREIENGAHVFQGDARPRSATSSEQVSAISHTSRCGKLSLMAALVGIHVNTGDVRSSRTDRGGAWRGHFLAACVRARDIRGVDQFLPRSASRREVRALGCDGLGFGSGRRVMAPPCGGSSRPRGCG